VDLSEPRSREEEQPTGTQEQRTQPSPPTIRLNPADDVVIARESIQNRGVLMELG